MYQHMKSGLGYLNLSGILIIDPLFVPSTKAFFLQYAFIELSGKMSSLYSVPTHLPKMRPSLLLTHPNGAQIRNTSTMVWFATSM